METKPDHLSTTECAEILAKGLHRNNNNNIKLISHSIDSLSDKIEGFLGQHYLVSIKYHEAGDKSRHPRTERYFMKVLNGSMQIIFEMSLSLNAYEKEKFLYEFLLPEFEGRGIDVSFAPRAYLCKPYLIVLEDLSSRGYRSAPKNDFLDVAHCRAGLKTLAKFHATSILYETAKTEELGRPYSLAETYPDKFLEMLFAKEENVATKWFRCSLEGVFGLMEVVPEDHVGRERFAAKLKEMLEDEKGVADYLSKFKGTVNHGDLWSNNFLFRYGEDGTPVDSVLIDYQLLKYGPPSLDVVHMIFSNTRRAFRDEHYEEFVDFYYGCLTESVAPLELEGIIPKREFLDLCDELKVITKVFCICDRGTTFIPDEIVGKYARDNELLKKFLFEDRGKVIVEGYLNGGLFKELMDEDISELRDMLFPENTRL